MLCTILQLRCPNKDSSPSRIDPSPPIFDLFFLKSSLHNILKYLNHRRIVLVERFPVHRAFLRKASFVYSWSMSSMSFSKAVSKQNPVFDLHFALVEDSTIATWRHDGTVFASPISSIPLHHPLPSYHLIAFVAEAIVRDDIMFHEKHQLLAYSCKHQHKSSNWNWRPLHKRPPLLTAHDIVALKIFQIHYWIFFISFTNDHVLSIDETDYVQCVQLNWLI